MILDLPVFFTANDRAGGSISASGDSCVILEFSSVLNPETNRQAAKAAAMLTEAKEAGRLTGILDIVPAMVTVGIHYQPERIICGEGERSPYEALCRQIFTVLQAPFSAAIPPPRRIDIPVCYGGAFGPDLAQTAERCGLSPAQLIEKHTEQWLEVLMLGFAPGHAYIGTLDNALNPPRRTTPRTRVRQGSIGLANRQSVIYPMDLPGGWNIIGRTPLTVFATDRETPCLLRNADHVKFFAIDESTFYEMTQEAQ
ncbi:5-oxoprolinase subunit PxpB [Affinibrenneria salicis]|uniref:5-oxoprolinase subunit PxpB n=1 Tax=Affinibrenneria salicis TaxID=2590031 RepID=A0A5J5FSI5_9GAMM|nr:5-oxoprolinase subunit PxpB [Affinibrenneria salicis]KAA8995753.1 5-oxoprolinase subunit PxpB [Affinibrenneria salicis]